MPHTLPLIGGGEEGAPEVVGVDTQSSTLSFNRGLASEDQLWVADSIATNQSTFSLVVHLLGAKEQLVTPVKETCLTNSDRSAWVPVTDTIHVSLGDLSVNQDDGLRYVYLRFRSKNQVPTPCMEISFDYTPTPADVADNGGSGGSGGSTGPAPYVSTAADLLNIDYSNESGLGEAQRYTGKAAIGIANTDYWNLVGVGFSNDYTYSNLKTSDQAVTSVSVQTVGAPGQWDWSGGGDPNLPNVCHAYTSYTYNYDGTPIVTTIRGLAAGKYDFIVYAHGNLSYYNSSVTMKVGSGASTAAKVTVSDPMNTVWDTVNWTEGAQYVAWRTVTVADGEAIEFTLNADAGYTPILNAIQVMKIGN